MMKTMAEVLAEFANVLVDGDGARYRAQACGSPMAHGIWQGWVEFQPIDGGPPVRSPRETTQPNRTDTEYWATGLSAIYLEGALRRALKRPVVSYTETVAPAFDEPAPPSQDIASPVPGREAVLDPFSAYDNEGEVLLRRQLAALSAWHLINITEAFDLSDLTSAALTRLPAPALIEIIVSSVVKQRTGR
jgi:hypothetical protein